MCGTQNLLTSFARSALMTLSLSVRTPIRRPGQTRKFTWWLGIYLGTAIGLHAGHVQAQDPRCIITDFDPATRLGGGFEICPRVTVTTGYDDNALRTESGQTGDAFFRLSPAVSARTVGTRHRFGLELGATANKQVQTSANDFVDLTMQGVGEFTISRNTHLSVTTDIQRSHQSRQALDTAGSEASLTKFVQPSLSLDLKHRRPFGFIRGSQTVVYKTFTDDPGGVAASSDTMNYKTNLKIGTNIARTIEVAIDPSFSYTHGVGSTSGTTTSDNYSTSLTANLNYRFTDITQLSISGGWLRSRVIGNPDAGRDTFTASGTLAWNPTDLTNINAAISTNVEQTRLSEAGTLIQREQSLRLKHDIDPAFDLDLGGRLLFENAQNSATESQLLSIDLGVIYNMNDHIGLKLRYNHDRRKSNGDASSFRNNTISLNLRAAY
mgnify:CR=1 FL=1